jgi:membrane associated rhomboid family serine protease
MQYASFFAVWLLGSLILGIVHGPAMGAFLGLAIAVGYLVALRSPAAADRIRRRRIHIYRQHVHDDPSTNG